MRKRISLLAVALLVAGTALVTEASAQSTPSGLTVRAGVFAPSERAVRDSTQDIWLTAGVEYKVGNLGIASSDNKYAAYYAVSLDYYGSGDFSGVPVLINYVGTTQQFHYSVGAGVTFGKTASRDAKATFGYRFAVGYDFSAMSKNPFFIEVGFLGATGSEFDSDLNGFFAVAGMRF